MYPCRAVEVAGNHANRQPEDFLSHVTNWNLKRYIIVNTGLNESSAELLLQPIRIDLAQAYVKYLDSLGATEQTPKFPSRYGIAEFHESVFEQYGASGAFGGTKADDWGFRKPGYDWCGGVCKD